MKLYLARHGEAVSKETDAQRPLSAQGREDVARVAGFLSLFEKPRPARFLHSGKLRAEQTARMHAEAWGVSEPEPVDGLAPNDDPAIWAERLAHWREDLALVGHLPHLERLAGLLLAGDAARRPIVLDAAGVVCLLRDEAGWRLAWLVIPRLLRGEV
ncbi:MAG: phosphohistidine phosphatase SixA [Mariprofundaceae bacterium]